MAIVFRESNWKAVRQTAQADGLALVPLGSLEQHGPHLPCGTDTILIDEITRRSVARCDTRAPICICPTIEYTLVEWAKPLASAGLGAFTTERTLLDILSALTDLGFHKIVFLHGHYGLPCARSASWEAWSQDRRALYVDVQPYEMAWGDIAHIAGEPLGHGGAAETAMMLATRPDLVHMNAAHPGPPHLWGASFPYSSLLQKGVYAIPTVESAPDGFEGDPTQASADMGNRLLDAIAAKVGPMLGELVSAPTPVEFTRAYRADFADE
jgi:creatinine amidohydrolase